MPLSIKKFDRFLEKHGMITSLFYIDSSSYCRMIEVYSTATDETFMIYISSSCRMTIGKGNNVFNISELDYSDTGDILHRYGDHTSISERSNQHDSIDLYSGSSDIESRMQDMYRKPIKITRDSNHFVEKDTFRQISRLSACVSNMKFKVCIQTSDLIYFSDPASDTIRIFSVSRNMIKRSKNVRKLNIIVDIETLFDVAKTASNDIRLIKRQLISNIHDNLNRNINTLSLPLVNKKYTSIMGKLDEYNERVNKLKATIEEVFADERVHLERKIALEAKTDSAITVFTFNKEVEFAKQLAMTNKSLNEISETKKELYLNVASLNIKYDNLMLTTDAVVFDIVVLSDTIKQKTDLMLSL
jgi:hypothetical protein